MRLYFKLLPFLLFTACGYQTDETGEFIRLEKELATMAHTYDSVEYINPDAEFDDWDDRMAEYTDSLLAISNAYDSLIIKNNQTDYSTELQTIQTLISRRRKNRNRDYRKREKRDTVLITNPFLDSDFNKYNLRVKLSYILQSLYTVTYCGNGVYETVESNHFLTYQRHGNTLEGEYGLGYVVTKDLISQLQLTHNNKTITPQTLTANYQKTEATFIPQDTGTYTLTGYITLDDPITGKQRTIQKQRSIYVKP